jgi:hypothetical protein
VIRFFSESNPVKILSIFIFGILIRLPYFADPSPVEIHPEDGYFYQLLSGWIFRFFGTASWILAIVTYVLIFLQGLSINGFINSQKLFGNTHLLFVFAYVLFSSLMPGWNVWSPFILVNTIMIFVFPKLINLYQKYNVQNELFLLSVMISLSTFLYKPSVLLIAFFYIALSIIRTFSLSEWVIVLIGFLLPYYLLFVYAYVWENSEILTQIYPSIHFEMPVLGRNPADLIACSFLLVSLLLGLWYVNGHKKRTLALQRKIWAINYCYLLTTVCLFFCVQHAYFDALFLLLLPASFYITGFLYYPAGKFFPTVFSWLMIGFLLVHNFL